MDPCVDSHRRRCSTISTNRIQPENLPGTANPPSGESQHAKMPSTHGSSQQMFLEVPTSQHGRNQMSMTTRWHCSEIPSRCISCPDLNSLLEQSFPSGDYKVAVSAYRTAPVVLVCFFRFVCLFCFCLFF